MSEIKPNEVYTTKETRGLLKISESTLKRMLKKGIIRANKIGGNYRILGAEILRLVSPKAENRARNFYQRLKQKLKIKLLSGETIYALHYLANL